MRRHRNSNRRSDNTSARRRKTPRTVGATPPRGRKSACPGEIVFRDEMRRAPPHILLTNYSMLEYLLIRPNDSPLFDGDRGARWRTIVLDEAHQYRGAKGMEMGMLIRRLKQRSTRRGTARSVSLHRHQRDPFLRRKRGRQTSGWRVCGGALRRSLFDSPVSFSENHNR